MRYKLGIRTANPLIASSPTIDIHAKPGEISQLGKWLPEWLDAKFRVSHDVKAPPIKLLSWQWANTPPNDSKTDLMSTEENWHKHTFLWSEGALEELNTWLHSDTHCALAA